MRIRVLALVAVTALATTGCWSTSPVSGARVGGPLPDGHHTVLSSQDLRFYGCPTIPGATRCADRFEIGLGEPIDIDPVPKSGGGLAPFRITWKDPATLAKPPTGSPKIVLRLEFINSHEPLGSVKTCGQPGVGSANIPAQFTASNVTAIRCTPTADLRMVLDIGLKKKVGFQYARCLDTLYENGLFVLQLEGPANADPWTDPCPGKHV